MAQPGLIQVTQNGIIKNKKNFKTHPDERLY
jgi:hypothetical protein